MERVILLAVVALGVSSQPITDTQTIAVSESSTCTSWRRDTSATLISVTPITSSDHKQETQRSSVLDLLLVSYRLVESWEVPSRSFSVLSKDQISAKLSELKTGLHLLIRTGLHLLIRVRPGLDRPAPPHPDRPAPADPGKTGFRPGLDRPAPADPGKRFDQTGLHLLIRVRPGLDRPAPPHPGKTGFRPGLDRPAPADPDQSGRGAGGRGVALGPFEDYDQRLSTDQNLRRHYELLACFRKDMHKVETYLTVAMCRLSPEANCTL
ncbi:hypothetical protein WMY93_001693 [Mugilogobius chulae]|uniref:Somatotropin n=1 Tax=Mugilogobius chulae TaxID=88201 RepID=A0AAW0Q2C6_9GOBI